MLSHSQTSKFSIDKFLCDKFTLPSVRVYAQHFLYDKFFLPVCTSQQFYFDKFSLLTVQTDKFFTLPIFSMTSALVQKLSTSGLSWEKIANWDVQTSKVNLSRKNLS